MSKVITFSTHFPIYHPKAGQPTFFVEKILAGLSDRHYPDFKIPKEFKNYDWYEYYNCNLQKHHTIRAGHRWKVGDKFSPRIWSGKPYRSKQIIIAPDIEIKKVWDFEIEVDKDYICVLIDKWALYEENSRMVTQVDALMTFAKNDGLSLQDFKDWFKWGTPFDGQIICWNENIEY